MTFYTSGRALREALGERVIQCIRKLDPLPEERRKTGNLRSILLRKFAACCGYCHAPGPLEAAHVVPLEIGAETTPDNIILLCKLCHGRYDSGHVSIRAMQRCANKWRNGIPCNSSPVPLQIVPSPSITPPPTRLAHVLSTVLELQRERKYRKAIQTLLAATEGKRLDLGSRIYRAIKIGELTRRRSTATAVTDAMSILEKIDAHMVPAQYQPVFFYELMYVYRLDGQHQRAANVARASVGVARKSSSGGTVDYVAARVNELLCEIAARSRLTKRDTDTLVRELRGLEYEANKEGKYWGGRWALNCRAHMVQVYVKAQSRNSALETWDQLREMYFDSDTAVGWDAGGKQTMSQLEGLVRVTFPRSSSDPKVGVGLLARSFLSRLGYRQRPEGIRDVGFGLARGLRALGGELETRLAMRLEEAMIATVDGTSVLWSFSRD